MSGINIILQLFKCVIVTWYVGISPECKVPHPFTDDIQLVQPKLVAEREQRVGSCSHLQLGEQRAGSVILTGFQLYSAESKQKCRHYNRCRSGKFMHSISINNQLFPHCTVMGTYYACGHWGIVFQEGSMIQYSYKSCTVTIYHEIHTIMSYYP